MRKQENTLKLGLIVTTVSMLALTACTNQGTSNNPDNAGGEDAYVVSGGIKFEDAEICARSTTSAEEICGGRVFADEEMEFGYRYEIELPPGGYFLFAESAEAGGSGAYTQFVECGMVLENCIDHLPIQVYVSEADGFNEEFEPHIYDWDFTEVENDDFMLLVGDNFYLETEGESYTIRNVEEKSEKYAPGEFGLRIYRGELADLEAKYEKSEDTFYLGQQAKIATLRNDDDPNGPGTGYYLLDSGWVVELDGESAASLGLVRDVLQTAYVSKDFGNKCNLRPDPGHCEDTQVGSFFNPASGTCREFAYSGCGGIKPFDNFDICAETCEYVAP